ncbi:hypothetical protein [Methylorubrum sp. POS3]|uniref:hypothetical protein n=1 Tax=Methylorubrum sp. POS3 TaxID=2998492 RepID=UPI0037277A22
MTASPMSRTEAVALGRTDPAASAYGAHMRDPGAIRREAERVRILMAVCRLPAATPVLVTTPADDVAAAAAELRRHVSARF